MDGKSYNPCNFVCFKKSIKMEIKLILVCAKSFVLKSRLSFRVVSQTLIEILGAVFVSYPEQ